MSRRSVTAAMLIMSIVAIVAAMASVAAASSWRSNGGDFTGTSGGGTLTVGTSSLSCAAATMTGQISTMTGPVYPSRWSAVTGTAVIKPCTVAGVNIYSVHCDYALMATAHVPALSGAHPFGLESTTGDFAINCTVFAGNTRCRTYGGVLGGTYANPTVTRGTAKLAFDTGPVTITAFPGVACALPTGVGHYSGRVFHIATAPSIWVL